MLSSQKSFMDLLDKTIPDENQINKIVSIANGMQKQKDKNKGNTANVVSGCQNYKIDFVDMLKDIY